MTSWILNRSTNVPWYLIVLLGAVLWGGEYSRRDLWAPDEARYALVSQEMREGNWLVPFRQGEFYSHKPPLIFWLTNVFSLLTGGEIGRLAPRLPSFLGAMLTIWVATRLAARWFSMRVAWMTFVLVPSTYLIWNKGGFGQIDMLLCGLEMAALYLLFSANGTRAPGRLAGAYMMMGLAVLAKGPVGLVVPLGVYAASTWAAGEKFARPSWHWLWGPFLALAFPGLWLLAAYLQGAPDGFFPELLFKQNVGRLAGEFGGHNKPFFYFLLYFPLDFLPWTFALPLSWMVLKRFPDYTSGRRRLLAWVVFVVLFFSLSASKRNLYILLVYPAAAMLVAAATDAWMCAPESWLRRTFLAMCGLVTLLAAGLVVGSIVPQIPFQSLAMLPGGLLMGAGAWWSFRCYKRALSNPGWLVVLALTWMAGFSAIGALVYPALNDLKTPDEIVEVAQAHLAPGDRLILFRQQGEIYSLYARRKGLMAFSAEELTAFIATAPQTNHMIITLERDVPDLQALLSEHQEIHRFTSGSKELVWITGTRATLLPGDDKRGTAEGRAGFGSEGSTVEGDDLLDDREPQP